MDEKYGGRFIDKLNVMDKRTRYISIEERINQLTFKNKLDRQEVGIAFDKTMEQLRPSNLIAHSLDDFVKSAQLGRSIANVGMSVLLGFVTKKLKIADSVNPIKAILSSILSKISAISS